MKRGNAKPRRRRAPIDHGNVDAATRRARARDAAAILRVIRARDERLYRALLVVIDEASRAREILPSLMVIVDFVINQARREALLDKAEAAQEAQ